MAQVSSEKYPTTGFYLLHTRAWELMIGALIALGLNGKMDVSPSWVSNALSALGLVLIVASVFLFDSDTPFPSVFALIPTLGAGLIIVFAMPGTAVASILSTPAIVGIGLISYSAYLWHHPLFAFTRYQVGPDPGLVIMLSLSLLSLLLGWISWRLVEAPFRSKNLIGTRAIFGTAAFSGCMMLCVGFAYYALDGVPQRAPESYQQVVKTLEDRSTKRPTPRFTKVLGNGDNIIGVVIGDSHAESIAEVLDTDLSDANFGLELLTKAGCPPVRGLLRHDLGRQLPSPCHEAYVKTYQHILQNDALEVVVIAARFTLYLESDRFDNGEGGIERGASQRVIFDGLEHADTIRDDATRHSLLAKRFTSEFQALLDAGKQVVLVYPIPEVGWNVSEVAWKWRGGGPELEVSTSMERFGERNRKTISVFDSLGEQERLSRVRPDQLLCNTFFPDRCAAVVSSRALYWDTNHMTNFGAAILVPEIVAAIAKRAN